MPLLNDPVGYEPGADGADWSPELGFRRGLVHGGGAALMLALLLAPAAAFLPYVVLPWIVRTPLTFGITWLLFLSVERAAGYMSPRIIALTLMLALLVLCSNHVALALANVAGAGMAEEWWIFPANLTETMLGISDSRAIGWSWLHPYVLASINVVPLVVAGGFCAALKSRG